MNFYQRPITRPGGESSLRRLLPAAGMLAVALLAPSSGFADPAAPAPLPQRMMRSYDVSERLLEDVHALGAALQDPDVFVREISVKGLRQLSAAIHDALAAALDHDEEAVRWAALATLIGEATTGNAGLQEADTLEKALDDSSAFVRRAAVAALLQLVEEVDISLEGALVSEDPVIRQAAMRVLLRRTEDVDRTIELALSSEDPALRSEAFSIHVNRMSPDEAVAYLAAVLGRTGSPLRGLAMRALAALEPRTDEVLQLLRAGLQDQDFDLWITATEALAPRAVPRHERQDGEAESTKAVMTLRLPRTEWRFSRDPQANGHLHGWFDPDHDDTPWEEIATETAWPQDYVGIGWYRRSIELPERPEHASAELLFGGVDESSWIWVNGVYVGGQDIGPGGWDQPFRVDVTAALHWGKPNHITVRVKNTAFAGGIWKPITLEALQGTQGNE